MLRVPTPPRHTPPPHTKQKTTPEAPNLRGKLKKCSRQRLKLSGTWSRHLTVSPSLPARTTTRVLILSLHTIPMTTVTCTGEVTLSLGNGPLSAGSTQMEQKNTLIVYPLVHWKCRRPMPASAPAFVCFLQRTQHKTCARPARKGPLSTSSPAKKTPAKKTPARRLDSWRCFYF